MHLYFSPMACSLATRIALYEAGAQATFTAVNTSTKRTADGDDFYAVNPMGQVPALRTDDGVTITENTAVLQYVAETFPDAQLMPVDAVGRASLRQWLGFTGTELHKAVFVPLLDPKAPADVKAYARDKAKLRLDLLDKHLSNRPYLLDRFSVADVYLATILNWAPFSGVDLSPWPNVVVYHQNMLKRPHVARALGEEFAMFKEEQARRAK